MAPKKKPAGDGDSELWDNFKKLWDKSNKEFEITSKLTCSALEKIIDGGEAPSACKCWNFDSEFDPMAFQVFCHCLRQSAYIDIDAIRLWKCGDGDKAVRSVCYYLDMQPEPGVKDLQFTDNGITELGCEFLGRTLGPAGNKVVNLLMLDYNKFGTPGVLKLSQGLSQNATLRKLSLNYCGIGEDGGQYIAQIVMFYKNCLECLHLRGNYLRNVGVVEVFNSCRRKEALAELDVFDNKFRDSDAVVKALTELFENNVTLVKYDLRGNLISDQGASRLVQAMVGKAHLQEVLVTERLPAKTHEALRDQLGAAKGKKKGKKK
eukprot:TRINITY_DN26500_c0_g1_i1.p1 TRINITY_DN26500_c0_g1~~TRINITY_DN26500_c0_g1_i1.p1  ORF type:complete len:331 (-),score=61.83 TRINITY_DN26500_c0_g1_i1:23-982(-)